MGFFPSFTVCHFLSEGCLRGTPPTIISVSHFSLCSCSLPHTASLLFCFVLPPPPVTKVSSFPTVLSPRDLSIPSCSIPNQSPPLFSKIPSLVSLISTAWYLLVPLPPLPCSPPWKHCSPKSKFLCACCTPQLCSSTAFHSPARAHLVLCVDRLCTHRHPCAGKLSSGLEDCPWKGCSSPPASPPLALGDRLQGCPEL